MNGVALAGLLAVTTLGAWGEAPPLSRQQAEDLALRQASLYEQAHIQEKIAAEDVRIAHAALVPKLAIPLGALFNTPALGPSGAGLPAQISANALTEYQAGYAISGTIDISGNLHAAMERSRALLEAAHAGTLVARRQLVGSTDESYYAVALASARRAAAENNLATARQAEEATASMLKGGEVAGIDGVRSHLIRLSRQDELQQARAAEEVAVHGLKVFIGYEFSEALATTGLGEPQAGDLEDFNPGAVAGRSEFAQFSAQLRASGQEAEQARSELKPQLTYSFSVGIDSNTLALPGLYQHSGLAGAIFLNIPLSDGGAAHAREMQAQLRGQLVESQRQLALRQFQGAYADAYTQARSAAERAPLAREALTEASKDIEVSVARYRAGEATILEITDAQTRLATQRAALDTALYDYQLALCHLRQAVGP